MIRFSITWLASRPRNVFFKPPPLAKRPADFLCRVCQNRWSSQNVWVSKTTQRCYQGETCEACGTSNKPYYIGRAEETIFNRVTSPHPVKVGASTSRHGAKLRHNRFNRNFKRTH